MEMTLICVRLFSQYVKLVCVLKSRRGFRSCRFATDEIGLCVLVIAVRVMGAVTRGISTVLAGKGQVRSSMANTTWVDVRLSSLSWVVQLKIKN